MAGKRGGPHPQTPLGFPAPHLHRPVDVEVMQERVLDLGQNLTEELEHLLPHAGGVLRGRAEGRSGEGAVPLGTLPSSPARGHLLCKPPSLTVGTGPLCAARPRPTSFFSISLSSLNTQVGSVLITTVSPDTRLVLSTSWLSEG